MFYRMVVFAMLGLLCSLASGSDVLTGTSLGATVGALPWRFNPGAVLGSQVYEFGATLTPTTAPAIGDAAVLKRWVKQIAMCAAMSRQVRCHTRPGLAATGVFVANTAATSGMTILSFVTDYLLPQNMDPGSPAAATCGEIVIGGALYAVRTSIDTLHAKVMQDMAVPTSTRGATVVAYLPVGIDVSEQMQSEIVWHVCAGQKVVIGQATMDMIPNGYVPFSDAWAYSVISNKVQTSNAAPAVSVVDQGKGQQYYTLIGAKNG